MCVVLACAALFSQSVLADTGAVLPQPRAVLSNAGDVAEATSAAIRSTTDDDNAEDANGAPASPGADLADDPPELMPIATLWLATETGLDHLLQRPLHTVPHPFPERPQRPPRLTTFPV